MRHALLTCGIDCLYIQHIVTVIFAYAVYTRYTHMQTMMSRSKTHFHAAVSRQQTHTVQNFHIMSGTRIRCKVTVDTEMRNLN